ncbi:Subtilisin inhibitor-like protein 4 [Streptomyces sp. YIM 130001]|uniref:SSI family serine proteinase inhibitor n=1 Tax=Streptomyces sp. YIM 130001 TaxID=2259644 RepID=UPI000E651B1D|nr:SSI family serine proteinase inhibitor [Streptomyces sp. YIM 130001]RII11931.1 Subtilisin inhibitor-like protein 4 [Streptomyces sp. YIM 130001]
MLRRLAVTAVASVAALCAAPGLAQAADAAPLPLGRLDLPPVEPDRLTVTVAETGGAGDGTYELECGPGVAAGTHPAAEAACEQLDGLAAEDRDPFAPVSADAMCTMQYGGPATARVTGSWQGKPVDAAFERGDGCEIGRWDALVPVLPEV